ncbi:MAG: MotA/TolQ/ExbB proton channel family protein [Deltaproteobacteria bacterium]|nr:MAG: MotA/TolQ/ExbB proton channel family protein [Deltaproteobacteria bacterium]
MWGLIVKGGWVMYPLIGLSVIALAIIIERWVALHRLNVNTTDFVTEINELLAKNEMEEAIARCERENSPAGRVIMAGLKNFRKSREEVESAIETAGEIEIAKLEKGLLYLLTIAKISPLLGFFGTVVGMIRAFEAIGRFGVENPRLVALGISEALITTAAGLVIAIPVFFAHFYFTNRINRFVLSMQESTLAFLETLGELEEKIALRAAQIDEIGGEYIEV